MMQDFLIKIKLRSPVGTPWHSDTIFGHLAWQVQFGVIDIDTESFLAPFIDRQPPFVISDGFPEGLLPMPILGHNLPETDDIAQYRTLKKRKKSPYCTTADFLKFCRGESVSIEPVESPWKSYLSPHASIDRLTNTTGEKGEGGFYETSADYIDTEKSSGVIDIYLRSLPDWKDKVWTLFQSLAQTGYGRDKSIGLGVFDTVSIETFADFNNSNGANGFVSLSSMVPAADDPTDAYFRSRTKYGKLGEGIFGNPFKRPFLQMEAGAVFKTNKPLKPFYGRLLQNIAPGFPKAVQNGYAFVVPAKIA